MKKNAEGLRPLHAPLVGTGRTPIHSLFEKGSRVATPRSVAWARPSAPQHAVVRAEAGIQERRTLIAVFSGTEAPGLPHHWPLAAVLGETIGTKLRGTVRLAVGGFASRIAVSFALPEAGVLQF